MAASFFVASLLAEFWRTRLVFSTLPDIAPNFSIAFPEAQVPLCIAHLARQSLPYVRYKEREAVAADLQRIYRAATREEAEVELDSFAEK